MMFNWEQEEGRYAPGWFIGSEDEDGSHRRDTLGWPYSIYRKGQEPGVTDMVLCHGIQDFGDATELHRRITQGAGSDPASKAPRATPAEALLTESQRAQMLENGRANAGRERTTDFKPVVAKLFCPWGLAIWLLTELDPEDPDIAFGLCDLGMGFPELGSVRLSEMESISGPGGLRIERDLHFKAAKTLSAYAREAHALQRIKA